MSGHKRPFGICQVPMVRLTLNYTGVDENTRLKIGKLWFDTIYDKPGFAGGGGGGNFTTGYFTSESAAEIIKEMVKLVPEVSADEMFGDNYN